MEKNRKFYNFNWGTWLLQSVVVWFVMLAWWQMFYSFLPIKADFRSLLISTYVISAVVLLLIAGRYKKVSIPIGTLLLAVGIWKYHIVFASAINHLVNAFLESYYTTVDGIGTFEVYVTDARGIGMALAMMGIPLICILAVVLRTGKAKILAVMIFLLPFVVASMETTFPTKTACMLYVMAAGVYFANAGVKEMTVMLKRSMVAAGVLLIVGGLGSLIGSRVESVKEQNMTAYEEARKNTGDTITKTMQEWKDRLDGKDTEETKEAAVEDSVEDVTAQKLNAETDENTSEDNSTQDVSDNSLVDENLITGIIAGDNAVNLTDYQESDSTGVSDMANLKALAYFEPAGKNLGTVTLDEKPQKTVYVTKHYGGKYHGNSWSERSDTDEVLEEDTKKPVNVDRLTALCEEHPQKTMEEAEQFIRRELEENTVYSYAPGSTPSNQDFAEYFLFENRKGFCVHFATTATLIYRIYGFAARYADGYAVKASAFRQQADGTWQATITGEMGHAWCEVYENNMWMVKEHTLAYQGNNRGNVNLPAVSGEEEHARRNAILRIICACLIVITGGVVYFLTKKLMKKKRMQSFQADGGAGVQNMYLAVCQKVGIKKDFLSQETLVKLKEAFPDISAEEWERMQKLVLESMFRNREVRREEQRRMYGCLVKLLWK